VWRQRCAGYAGHYSGSDTACTDSDADADATIARSATGGNSATAGSDTGTTAARFELRGSGHIR
jgi:hypothetical protein